MNCANILNRVNKDLDKILAISFIFISFSIVSISIILGHIGVVLPLIVLCASIFYYLYNITFRELGHIALTGHSSITLVGTIIFFIIITLLLLISWSSTYSRPYYYFILIFINVVLIVVDIFSINYQKSLSINVILLKIVILCLVVYSNIYFEFPGIYGADPWWHIQWIKETIDQGYITIGTGLSNSYYFSPIFHIFISITTIVTDISIYSAVFISIGFPISLLCIYVYIFGKRFFDPRVCLIASFLIPLSSVTIERATMLIPMSLGFFYFLIIQILLLNKYVATYINRLLTIIIMVPLIFTHPIASIIASSSLVVRYLGITLSGSKLNRYQILSPSIIAFSFILMILNFMRIGQTSSISLFDGLIFGLITSVNADAQFVLTSPPATSNLSDSRMNYILNLIGNVGFLILLLFFIIALLSCMRYNSRRTEELYLVFLASLLIIIPYAFIFFKLDNILPDRWSIFSNLPLTLLGVIGLFKSASIFEEKRTIIPLIIFWIILILIPLAASSIANNDNPFLFNNAVRLGFTQSEITALQTLSKHEAGYPITDLYYGDIIPYIIGYDKYKKMIINNNGIFILRNYYINHPQWDRNYRIPINLGRKNSNSTGIMNVFDFMNDQGILENDLIYNSKVKVYSFSGYKNILK